MQHAGDTAAPSHVTPPSLSEHAYAARGRHGRHYRIHARDLHWERDRHRTARTPMAAARVRVARRPPQRARAADSCRQIRYIGYRTLLDCATGTRMKFIRPAASTRDGISQTTFSPASLRQPSGTRALVRFESARARGSRSEPTAERVPRPVCHKVRKETPVARVREHTPQVISQLSCRRPIAVARLACPGAPTEIKAEHLCRISDAVHEKLNERATRLDADVPSSTKWHCNLTQPVGVESA